MGFLSTIGGLVGGMFGFPGVGSLLGGIGDSVLGGNSAKSAANTQANAASQAAQAQLAMYGQTRSDQMPWLSQGGGAINQLGYLMGVNPYIPQTSPKFAMPAATKKAPYAPYNTMPNYAGGTYNASQPGGLGSIGNAPLPGSGNYNVGFEPWLMGSNPQPNPAELGNIGPTGIPQYGSLSNMALGAQPPSPSLPPNEGPSTPNGGTQPSGGTPWQPNTAMGGFGSLAKPFGMADYQADPGYAFRLSEGQKALERSAAARGGLLSGAALKATDRYSQGMASQEYGNAYDRYNTNQNNLYNRLAGLSGTGQTSAGQLGSAGGNAANLYGQGLTAAAYQRAAGQTAGNNAWQTGLGQLGGALGGIFGGGGNSTTSGGLYGGGSGNYGNLGTINWYA